MRQVEMGNAQSSSDAPRCAKSVGALRALLLHTRKFHQTCVSQAPNSNKAASHFFRFLCIVLACYHKAACRQAAAWVVVLCVCCGAQAGGLRALRDESIPRPRLPSCRPKERQRAGGQHILARDPAASPQKTCLLPNCHGYVLSTFQPCWHRPSYYPEEPHHHRLDR